MGLTSADLNLRIELPDFDNWMRANKLTLKTSRTKYNIFASKYVLKEKTDLNLKLHTDPTQRLTSFEYFEVILDEHIGYVGSKASKNFRILRSYREEIHFTFIQKFSPATR